MTTHTLEQKIIDTIEGGTKIAVGRIQSLSKTYNDNLTVYELNVHLRLRNDITIPDWCTRMTSRISVLLHNHGYSEYSGPLTYGTAPTFELMAIDPINGAGVHVIVRVMHSEQAAKDHVNDKDLKSQKKTCSGQCGSCQCKDPSSQSSTPAQQVPEWRGIQRSDFHSHELSMMKANFATARTLITDKQPELRAFSDNVILDILNDSGMHLIEGNRELVAGVFVQAARKLIESCYTKFSSVKPNTDTTPTTEENQMVRVCSGCLRTQQEMLTAGGCDSQRCGNMVDMTREALEYNKKSRRDLDDRLREAAQKAVQEKSVDTSSSKDTSHDKDGAQKETINIYRFTIPSDGGQVLAVIGEAGGGQGAVPQPTATDRPRFVASSFHKIQTDGVVVPDSLIREILMKHGYTIKEGQTDLKPCVYEGARELIGLVLEQCGLKLNKIRN